MDGLLDAMAPSPFAKLLSEAEENSSNRDTGSAENLKRLGSLYLTPPLTAFKPGDLVTWKEGLKNVKWPAYGRPAVVLELSEGDRDPRSEAGSPYFREPRNMRIGMLGSDGDFDGWWVDGNRMAHYEEPPK